MNKAGLANFPVSWRVPETGVADPFMGERRRVPTRVSTMNKHELLYTTTDEQ